ncbi:MAG: tetratricopeptide repeat protein [Bacteroidetes bacterium]|nr:tetratricopeptide repeat protein [Bacteroidota bacterium]
MKLKLETLEDEFKKLETEIKEIEKSSSESISDSNKDSESKIEAYKNDLKDLMNLYVFFITVGLILIGFAINFFGKSAIKKRVEEIIAETAQKHIELKIVETLNSKITNDLIETVIINKSDEEINKIISSIEHKGVTAINQIKKRGDDAIKSMLATPKKVQFKIEKKQPSDQEITRQNNENRAEEFFELAFKSKDPRIQIGLYKNVIEFDPDNANALNNMAASFNDLNDPASAIELLNKAIKLDPSFPQAYANRAMSYNLLGDFNLALEDCAKAIEYDPKFEYAYAIKGNILTKQGKYAEAEIALNTSVEMDPESAEPYYNRAFFYEETNKFEKSQIDYEKAEELGFSNKAMLFNNMAVLNRRLKKFDKAIELLEKAKKFNPDFPNLDGTLALIYADKNDDEKFFSHLQIALEKGCKAWNYLSDSGFEKYRDSKRLQLLLEPYKKKYYA